MWTPVLKFKKVFKKYMMIYLYSITGKVVSQDCTTLDAGNSDELISFSPYSQWVP